MQVGASWDALGLTVLTTVAVLVASLVLTRLYGLRAFAKMAPMDFAVTVAIGSLVASTAAGSVPLLQGVVCLGVMFLVQHTVAAARVRGAASVLDNTPKLVMVGSEILHDALEASNVTLDDLRAKLREANVLDLGQVRAVVVEATGDVAVLHDDSDARLDPWLLDGVRGTDDIDQQRRHAAMWHSSRRRP